MSAAPVDGESGVRGGVCVMAQFALCATLATHTHDEANTGAVLLGACEQPGQQGAVGQVECGGQVAHCVEGRPAVRQCHRGPVRDRRTGDPGRRHCGVCRVGRAHSLRPATAGLCACGAARVHQPHSLRAHGGVHGRGLRVPQRRQELLHRRGDQVQDFWKKPGVQIPGWPLPLRVLPRRLPEIAHRRLR
eukprot:Gregarina_sp_Pseudo_9__2513@NODE_278_length_3309_cov_8_730275_g260_i0_p3_GENE_NODE_278_length_3309_cov_8_730275_g260_i0NODE_278_length_3309_cov_8_730275_g260_i0_p3_ORF_typecomplete_len190_score1_95Shadoo/PF14999_6/0_44_NODE_278_length_3309_cov_8_730275_g260_i06231192